MIRAKQVKANELDDVLVSLQEEGSKIWQIHPCPTNLKGQQEDIGKGQTSWGAVIDMNFMITYFTKDV